MPNWIVFTITFLCASLTSCMATPSYRSSTAHLCGPIVGNGWSDGARNIGGVSYDFTSFIWAKQDKELPLQGVYWVGVHGITLGAGAGEYAPPMIYDSGDAELEVSGRKIKAIRRLWRSDTGVDGLSEVSVPANLNVRGKIVSPSFYIAFPVKIDDPMTEFVFRSGTILLDGVRYPLPVYKSCYDHGGFRWYPIT